MMTIAGIIIIIIIGRKLLTSPDNVCPNLELIKT